MPWQECEKALFDRFDGTSKDYKQRFRSLMFNLRDAKERPPRAEHPTPPPTTPRAWSRRCLARIWASPAWASSAYARPAEPAGKNGAHLV